MFNLSVFRKIKWSDQEEAGTDSDYHEYHDIPNAYHTKIRDGDYNSTYVTQFQGKDNNTYEDITDPAELDTANKHDEKESNKDDGQVREKVKPKTLEGTEFEDNPLYESQEGTVDEPVDIIVNQYSLANPIQEDEINATITTEVNAKYGKKDNQEEGRPNEPVYSTSTKKNSVTMEDNILYEGTDNASRNQNDEVIMVDNELYSKC